MSGANVADRADEFYVGYADAPPAGIARRVRRAVLALACLTIAAGLTLVLAQERRSPASFEFGVTRSFRGTVREAPVPTLLVARPDADGAGPATSSYLLVAPGKHGAHDLVQGRDGQTVELAGSLIYRDGRTMIEVVPGSIQAAASSVPSTGDAPIDLGAVTLRGEIVDAKCHLGVMNPGDGKTHRGCAARCISGGIPPALHVRDAAGNARLYLLVGPHGEGINDAVLPYVSEPVEINGRAERRGDLLVAYVEPSAIRRLGEEG
jgi:hypothetical protein